jgi:hypothetical protein
MAVTLIEQIAQEPVRSTVVEECCVLIDTQVKSKGFVIKSGYAAVKALKKRFVPEVVDGLLNDWLAELQPHYERWQTGKQSTFADYIISRSDDVAEDLLKVTDRRAEKSSHGTAKKMYGRLRDSAKKNVVEAIPDLARLIQKHLA